MNFSVKIVFIFIFFVNLYGNSEVNHLPKNKIITVCINPSWEPIEFLNKDTQVPDGITIDTLKLIKKKLNNTIQFKYIKTSSWKESQQFLKDKKCDILPSAVKTKQREEYAIFTKPYLKYNLAIITQKDKPFVNNIEDIIDKTFARNKDSGLISILQNKYESINIIKTESYIDSIQMVSKGKSYSTFAVLPVFSYYINKFAINNLHIAGYLDIKYNLSIAVRKDKIELLNLLNNTLSMISYKERKKIHDNWSSVEVVEKTDYSFLWKILLSVFVLILIILYSNYKLKVIVKQRTHELNKEKELFKTLFEDSSDGLLLIQDGKFVECNKAIIKLLKYETKDDFLNIHPSEISPEYQFDGKKSYEKANEFINRCLKDGFVEFEWIHTKSDGTNFWCKVTLNKIYLNGIETIHTRWRNIDKEKKLENKNIQITNELIHLNEKLEQKVKAEVKINKQNQIQILEQAKMASMGEMLSNIAHQWRQPLSAITTIATGMKVQKELDLLNDEEFNHNLDNINTNAQYLSKTIDTFRSFILEEKDLKEVFIQDRIDKSLSIISVTLETNHIKLINNIDYSKPIRIMLVLGELSQVILNIINNAKDALIERKIENPWIKIDIEEKEEQILINIEDNGGGIPENILPKIFDPYFTTKHRSQGTGLGLHMSYKIISERMKGKLYPINTSVGVKFVIEIPKT